MLRIALLWHRLAHRDFMFNGQFKLCRKCFRKDAVWQ